MRKFRISSLKLSVLFIFLFNIILWNFILNQKLYFGGDCDFAINNLKIASKYLYLWDDSRMAGWFQAVQIPKLFPHFILGILEKYFGIKWAEILFFSILLTYVYFTISLWLSSLLKNYKYNDIVVILVASFAMYNNYVIFRLHNGTYPFIFTYGSVPLGFIAIDYLFNNKYKIKSFAFLAIALFLGGHLSAPHIFSAYLGILFLYSLHYFFNGVNLFFFFKNWVIIIIIFSLVHLYWIIPGIIFLLYSSPAQTKKYLLETIPSSNTRTVLNAFRGLPDWNSLLKNFDGRFIFNVHGYWNNPILILATCLLPIVIGLNLILSHKYSNKFRSLSLASGLMLIFGIFICKATSPPFGNLFNWSLHNLPLFYSFRGPELKFGFWFYISFILNFFILLIIFLSRAEKLSILIYLLSISIILLNVYYFPTLALNKKAKFSILVDKKIVGKYQNMVQKINSDNYVLISPWQGTWPWYYDVNGLSGSYFLQNLFVGKRVLVAPEDGLKWFNNFYENLWYDLNNHYLDPSALKKFLTFHNIGQIFHRLYFKNGKNNKILEDNLKKLKLTSYYIKNFDLYLLKLKDVSPLLFTSNCVQRVLNFDDAYRYVAFLSKIVDICNYSYDVNLFIKGESPVIKEINKISPVEYKFSISDISSPFVLVFMQSFHPLWRLYVEKDKKFIKLSGVHFVVNSFGNGWLVQLGDLKKIFNGRIPDNVELKLEFYGQKYYVYSLVVSLSLVSVSIIYLSISTLLDNVNSA